MPEGDCLQKIKDHLKNEFGLDDGDVKELLSEYVSNLGKIVAVAEAANAKGEFDALRKAGHSIKGIAGNMGADEISQFGRFIEDNAMLGGGDSSKFLPAIKAIREHYEAIKSQG